MRFGGPIYGEHKDPESWIGAVRRAGYRAVWPPDVPKDSIAAFLKAAAGADLVIAEVGAWSNPISPNEEERQKALKLCKDRLAQAEAIGARCCVNIAGARCEKWDGPHKDNLSQATFDLIVETVREIIDAVKPTRTFYTLETMPWIPPHSADSYLQLIRAIDRKQFAVHLDPVNLVNCPERYFFSGEMIRECFAKLGPYIKSCHAKDILISNKLTLHLDEVRPGTGGLDYSAFLTELNKLDKDTPLMMEHLPNQEEYEKAATYIRTVAAGLKISL
jgi:sugar phosphate isomerase/epimerase